MINYGGEVRQRNAVTTIQMIRQRRLEKDRMDTGPKSPCVKCGCFDWYKGIDHGVWYCFSCGNAAYLDSDGYRQVDRKCSMPA